VRFVNGTQTAIEPAAPALELTAHFSDFPLYKSCTTPADRQSEKFFELRGEQGYVSGYYVLRFIQPGECAQIAATMVEIKPVRFANGAYLVGWHGFDTSDGIRTVLAWRLSGPVSEDYQAFVHFLDANGQKLAQADRPAWPGRYWRAGDTLFLWFDVVVPPEAETLYAGMYTLDGAQASNVQVLDAQGAYLAQGAEIPLRN
jgi:hypothetical protein